MQKIKKDFLFGLNSKIATGLGVALYLISRFGFGGAIFEIAGIILFIVGLYRWNKEIREKAKTKKEKES